MENITRLPAEMITELAMGIEDPFAIARRHGFTDQDYLQMTTYPWFTRAIDEKRDVLDTEGLTFKLRMGQLAEDMLVEAWKAARNSDSVQNKLDVAKYLTKVAGLEPLPNQSLVAPGAGFSLVITLPPTPLAPSQIFTLNGVPNLSDKTISQIEDAFTMDTGPHPEVDDLPHPPAYVAQVQLGNETLTQAYGNEGSE